MMVTVPNVPHERICTMFEEFSRHSLAVYGAYRDDDAKIMQSTSGGVAAALTDRMLSLGGYVAGVAYKADFSGAEYVVTNSPEVAARFKGSKYIDCDRKTVYGDVQKLLDDGQKVLFFGLPCTVAALYHKLGGRPENLVTCELICHGPTYAKVHEDYVARLTRKYRSRLTAFSVRHKKDGWKPPYLRAEFENGRVFEKPFYETEYGYAFAMLAKESCYRCRFKGNDRQGDLMIGDFWGITEKDECWNACGVSSVFVHTQHGADFLRSVPDIRLYESTFEKAVMNNPMVIKSRDKDPQRDDFAELLAQKGLFHAVKRTLGISRRCKQALKKLLPASLKPLVIQLYHRIRGH